MGKKAKEHRKKVAKRNRIIAQERKRYEKVTQQLLDKMNTMEGDKNTIESTLTGLPLSGPFSNTSFMEQPKPIIPTGPQI